MDRHETRRRWQRSRYLRARTPSDRFGWAAAWLRAEAKRRPERRDELLGQAADAVLKIIEKETA